jgi:hypothetical protein
MILHNLCKLNHFKVTRFAVKSKNTILNKIVKIVKILEKQRKWPYMHKYAYLVTTYSKQPPII